DRPVARASRRATDAGRAVLGEHVVPARPALAVRRGGPVRHRPRGRRVLPGLLLRADQRVRGPVTGVTPRGRSPPVKVVGDLVYVSGRSPRRPDNSIAGASADELGTARLDIREQTRAVIENVRAVLGSVGADLADLVQVTTYLVSMNDFGGY